MKRPRAHGLTRSVQDRLRNIAVSDNRPYAELLHLWALERYLYRFSRSAHSDQFVLKGALMMRVWQGVDSRPTRDIDLLGPVGISAHSVEELIRESLLVEVPPDGLDFDAESIRVRPIRIPEKHVGFRATFLGFLAKSRLRFQVDIGTGNGVVPDPVTIDYPTFLDFPPPRIRAYTPYTSIAEKFEALVKLGMANTRMKDYFDLALLATSLAFDGQILASALTETFESRAIEIPTEPPPGPGRLLRRIEGQARPVAGFLAEEPPAREFAFTDRYRHQSAAAPALEPEGGPQGRLCRPLVGCAHPTRLLVFQAQGVHRLSWKSIRRDGR